MVLVLDGRSWSWSLMVVSLVLATMVGLGLDGWGLGLTTAGLDYIPVNLLLFIILNFFSLGMSIYVVCSYFMRSFHFVAVVKGIEPRHTVHVLLLFILILIDIELSDQSWPAPLIRVYLSGVFLFYQCSDAISLNRFASPNGE